MRLTASIGALLLFSTPLVAQLDDTRIRHLLDSTQAVVNRTGPIAKNHQCYTRTNAACGSAVTDSVDIFGCSRPSAQYFNIHRFFVSAGTRLTVTVTSGNYAILTLLTNDAATQLLKSANAARGGSAVMTYDVPTSAYYVVSAGPLDNFITGPYTIRIDCAAIPTTPLPPTSSCTANSTTLCLNNSRFAVTVSWRDFDNKTGVGNANPMTTDTGNFWFFSQSNTELVIKVLDGRALNGKFWVFYGALSNVEYTITVRDTQTGQTRSYFNPLNTFASRGIVDAF